MPERPNSLTPTPLMAARRVGAITLARAEAQHHNALSKLVRTGVHGFSTSAYTWDFGAAF
jgi:hypothetical protein